MFAVQILLIHADDFVTGLTLLASAICYYARREKTHGGTQNGKQRLTCTRNKATLFEMFTAPSIRHEGEANTQIDKRSVNHITSTKMCLCWPIF